jgi:hypothetical protein
MPIALRLRNLDDGSLMNGEFEDADGAAAWLRERPEGIEVLGVAQGVDEVAATALQRAMRPLSPAERDKARALDDAKLARMQQAIDDEQAAYAASLAAQRDAASDADPDRPMAIAYEVGVGIRHAEDNDPRPIPDVVAEAVLAWVAERNAWVRPRCVHVARAFVHVWPGVVPGGDPSDRVQSGGQFDVEPGAAPET